jgi:pyruvate ferredoxin oxidoreductase delta subunit
MAKPADHYKWQELEVGFVVLEPGSAQDYKTGDWKSNHPVWDEKICIKCGLCYTYCPDMAVCQKTTGYFEGDMNYCKGCGICAHECPTGAIKMVEGK